MNKQLLAITLLSVISTSIQSSYASELKQSKKAIVQELTTRRSFEDPIKNIKITTIHSYGDDSVYNTPSSYVQASLNDKVIFNGHLAGTLSLEFINIHGLFFEQGKQSKVILCTINKDSKINGPEDILFAMESFDGIKYDPMTKERLKKMLPAKKQ